jgi:hypothetical protein
VGNGNIDVGSAPATRKSGQPVFEDLSGSDGPEPRIDPSVKTERQEKQKEKQQGNSSEKSSPHPASLCGAMSQQGSEFRGNVSAPQQFVHLVGCRDRKVGSGPGASQYPNRVKR